MNRHTFLHWGKRWHYPFLVVAPGLVLHHGKTSYEQADALTIRLAETRIEQWNALASPVRVTEAIARVENLLKTCSNNLVEVERV